MQWGSKVYAPANQAALRPSLCRACLGGVLVLGLLAGPVSAKEAEPPPSQFDSGPYTAKPVFVLNPDRDCRTIFGDPGQQKRFDGCYVPMTDEIILPKDCDASKGKIGSSCRALIRHEEGHARGWRH